MAFQFSEEKIKERIIFENPWWEDDKTDPRYSKLKHRTYFQPFFQLVIEKDPKRAVVLMGPRRVGKTVMIYHSIQELIKKGVPAKNICFISLDTPIYTGSLLEDLLRLFIKIHGHKKNSRLYVFFDEIQYLNNWEAHLKSLVDSYHHIKLCASGSAAAALKLKSDESGAGRFTDFVLPPLTFYEFLDIKGSYNKASTHIKELNKEFLNYINYGGYPEVTVSKKIQKNLERYVMNDIVEKVLLKDIPSIYGIQNVQELKSFFNYIAYHAGAEFSIDRLANESGIAKNTIKKYIEYLEASFLIKKLNRIDHNAKVFKREVAFKLYLTNPSLRSALFSPVNDHDPLLGYLVENAVFAQLLHDNPDNLYYARWDKGEIDFVQLNSLQNAQGVLEVKWSNRHADNLHELDKLVAFCHANKVEDVVVTTKDIHRNVTYKGIKITLIPSAFYSIYFSSHVHISQMHKMISQIRKAEK